MNLRRCIPSVGTVTDCNPTKLVICHAVPRRHVIAVVALTVGVVVVSSLIARNGEVPDWERSVLEFVNGWPDRLEAPMWFIQQVGVLAAPIVAGLVVVAFTRRWQHLVPFVLVQLRGLSLVRGQDREGPGQAADSPGATVHLHRR